LIAKRNLIYWKSYQYKKANIEDVFSWYNNFCDVNVGIVTGEISKLAVIDIDDLNLLPELSNTQRGIVCLLGTIFEGEYPSINKIAKTANMNFETVKRAIEVLKEMQVIEKSLYN
jgi:hypothetical protein